MSMHAHNGLLAACCKGLDGRLDEGCLKRWHLYLGKRTSLLWEVMPVAKVMYCIIDDRYKIQDPAT